MPDLSLPVNPSIKAKTKGLPSPLELVAQTVSNICSISDDCTNRLDRVEEELEEASGIEGVRVLRFRLAECLQVLREQARRQRDEVSQLFIQLQTDFEAAQKASEAKKAKAAEARGKTAEAAVQEPEIDKVSGLKVRALAERAMAAAIERGRPSYAALFVVDRLHLINAQFGYSTGDRILRSYCGHLRMFLLPQDQLFRWTGPAFVAVIERPDELADETEAEIQKIAASKLDVAVQIGNRSVLLPIVGTSVLMPLAGGGTLADLASRLDAFTGQQARH